MHSVGRSPEPTFLSHLRSSHTRWAGLEGSDRQQIRAALAQDFGNVCGYCEQSCRRRSATHDGRNEETIDHFKPRSGFPALWLDWLNLVYACRRCNKATNGARSPLTQLPRQLAPGPVRECFLPCPIPPSRSPQPSQAAISTPNSADRPPANLQSTRIRARTVASVTSSPPSAILAPSIGGFGVRAAVICTL